MGNKEGVCPIQDMERMVEARIIDVPEVKEKQIQPSSMDILLGSKVRCIRAGLLPTEGEDFEKIIQEYTQYEFEISEEKTGLLKKGETYLIDLQGTIDLPIGFIGWFNPKSTTGRSDTMTRVLVEGIPKFDTAKPGRRRKLYIEITPLSFNVIIKKGLALTQLRVGYGNCDLSEAELKIMHSTIPLLYHQDFTAVQTKDIVFHDNLIEIAIDLQTNDIVGYHAKINSQDSYNLAGQKGCMSDQLDRFWEPIKRPKDGVLVLEANSFYILHTKERVSFPPQICGILLPHESTYGEGRIHYAGFFDVGQGYLHQDEQIKGNHATLEIRVYHTPFVIRHGQPICLMRYQKMRDIPLDKEGKLCLYGTGKFASNYSKQDRALLGKQFTPPN